MITRIPRTLARRGAMALLGVSLLVSLRSAVVGDLPMTVFWGILALACTGIWAASLLADVIRLEIGQAGPTPNAPARPAKGRLH